MSEEPSLCTLCGGEHEPLDPRLRYHYATRPGTEVHKSEVEWFAKHGIIPHGMTQIEALALAITGSQFTKLHGEQASPSEGCSSPREGSRMI